MATSPDALVPGPGVTPAASASSSGSDAPVHFTARHRIFRRNPQLAGQHRSLTHPVSGPMRHARAVGLGEVKTGAAAKPL
jgi:hypothetical protein